MAGDIKVRNNKVRNNEDSGDYLARDVTGAEVQSARRDPDVVDPARPRERRSIRYRPTRSAQRDSVGSVANDQLEQELVNLAKRLASGTYELLVLVGEFDARGTWALHGALSCAVWLADLCDIEVATARTQVRVARALREYPALDTAMADGDISYAKARVLVTSLTEDNVDDLVALAEYTPAGRLGMAIAAWAQRNENEDLIAQRQHEARSCSWRTEPDGTVVFTARLTPEAAGAVCAVIDKEVMGRPIEPDPTDPHPTDSHPTLAQQRADAFVRCVGRSGDNSGPGGYPRPGPTAEVVVHVHGDGNTLADGTPLSDHAVGKMLPDAYVSLMIHDTQRQPIDASPRRRFPTRRQRRVVDELYPECAHPGCHARTFLQYDHIEAFSVGGLTTVANLQRLCGPHNREKAGA